MPAKPGKRQASKPPRGHAVAKSKKQDTNKVIGLLRTKFHEDIDTIIEHGEVLTEKLQAICACVLRCSLHLMIHNLLGIG